MGLSAAVDLQKGKVKVGPVVLAPVLPFPGNSRHLQRLKIVAVQSASPAWHLLQTPGVRNARAKSRPDRLRCPLVVREKLQAGAVAHCRKTIRGCHLPA